MSKPVLVIMAAGMGSRYGGLKQIDPVDEHGSIIIDFSIYDAVRAGFEKIVFIIKKQIEKDFKEQIGDRISKYVQVEYVYQELDKLPNGYKVPEGRIKPWGTAHAILCCKDVIDGAFAVINADDYYGRDAFVEIYNALLSASDDSKYRYCMVGYHLENTLSDNGHVGRGVCVVSKDHQLMAIHERTQIIRTDEYASYTEDNGQTWVKIPEGTIVSMNMWGFTRSIIDEIQQRFIKFLDTDAVSNPLKSEYFLPFAVGELLEEDKASVTVLQSKDKWYGVTYKEDKEIVVAAIRHLKEQGLYPEILWEKK